MLRKLSVVRGRPASLDAAFTEHLYKRIDPA
jgi:hypothetical protein